MPAAVDQNLVVKLIKELIDFLFLPEVLDRLTAVQNVPEANDRACLRQVLADKCQGTKQLAFHPRGSVIGQKDVGAEVTNVVVDSEHIAGVDDAGFADVQDFGEPLRAPFDGHFLLHAALEEQIANGADARDGDAAAGAEHALALHRLEVDGAAGGGGGNPAAPRLRGAVGWGGLPPRGLARGVLLRPTDDRARRAPAK